MIARIYKWDAPTEQTEPREVSWDEIKALFEAGHDVAIWHTIEQHATRKKPFIEGTPIVLTDKLGGRFRQR